jgi:hypothetical protein
MENRSTELQLLEIERKAKIAAEEENNIFRKWFYTEYLQNVLKNGK